MDIKTLVAEARTDLYPSPMPAGWVGTLTVSIVAMDGLTPMWGIKSNNAPIAPIKRNTDRALVEEAARNAITTWVDNN